MHKKTKYAILASLGILLIVSGLVYYFNYNLRVAKQDYEAKISDLNQQTAKNLQNLQNSLETQIDALGLNLSSQIGIVDSGLRDFKKQNQQQINTLSNLIDQIEQQSNIKLNELKTELK